MKRSVTAENWCKTCFFTIVFGVGVLIALVIGHWIRPVPTPELRGWCCLRVEEQCLSHIGPVSCGDEGGYAYTFDQATCQAVCTSLPPSHAGDPAKP